jgi:hypothetical protein
MTRSYPPKAEAFAFIFGQNSEKQGKYMRVESILLTRRNEGYILLFNSNKDIIVKVLAEVYPNYLQIKRGDDIMVWYNVITMSIPGQVTAKKLVQY